MSIDLVKRKVKVVVYKDKASSLYSFFLLEKGGPIVSSNSIEEGKLKFEKALSVASAVRNLQYYDDISIVNRVEFIRSNSTSRTSEIEYLTV